jgi:hypothetical protein
VRRAYLIDLVRAAPPVPPVGAPAHWTSSVLTTARDTVIPLLPGSVFGRSIAPAYAWTA